MTNLLNKHTMYACKLNAARLVGEYSNEEVRQRADLRHIPATIKLSERRRLLEAAIAQEMYWLEMGQLTLQPRATLRAWARQLHIPFSPQTNNVHLAWEIAMVIVRAQIPVKVTNDRKLLLL